MKPHARLQAWLARVRSTCAPHYDKVNALLNRAQGFYLKKLGGAGRPSKM